MMSSAMIDRRRGPYDRRQIDRGEYALGLTLLLGFQLLLGVGIGLVIGHFLL
jgi:hypothetical protein